MGIIVQKFGGTSLRNINKESDFLKHIKREVKIGSKLVIVVSAMGRGGEPYATDTLIGQLENISTIINPKKKDFIMSVGEIISAALVSHLLESEGLSSEALTGYQAGIITDDTFNSGRIMGINTNRIQRYLNRNKIVVVAGFQGATENMEITTLGRGGSDTTAVALGGYLGAERIDIFTDVPGVAITDPRMIPNVKYIEEISYDDMYSLAIEGASVIHPNAVLLGKEHNVPIRVLSTFLDSTGTLITNVRSIPGIIGIGVKKNKNNSTISLIFNNDYYENVTNKLAEVLNEEKIVYSIEYFNDKVSLKVNNEELIEFTKRLYDNFF